MRFETHVGVYVKCSVFFPI